MSLLDLSFQVSGQRCLLHSHTGSARRRVRLERLSVSGGRERFGVIKGSLIVSLIWSFWHAPIWFLGSGYSGFALLRYTIAFAICVTSVGFVMGLCYHSCRNLLVPVCIHFTLNFLGGGIYKGPMVDLVSWYALFYALTAAGYFLTERRKWELAREARPVS